MEHLKEVQHATEDVIELTETARDLTETMLQEQEQLQPVRLDRYLESRIDTVRSTYDDAVVRTDGVLPDVSVIADDMLEAVFRNLLQNAIVHNDKEIPEVTVSTHVDEGRVRVRIADNGPGVPDHRKEAIFGKKGSTALGRVSASIWSTHSSIPTAETCGSRITIPRGRVRRGTSNRFGSRLIRITVAMYR
ncbi:sensor histidine kinase [Natrialba swarupiae]|nr:sensor histidine kinase [Natrialba swarupiae]